jgi:hypothetical protein
MRKKLYILAILTLSVAILTLMVPAASLACSAKKPVEPPVVSPGVPVVPITIPDSSLTFLDAALNDLAAAVATHDDAAIAQYFAAAEQKLGQALPDTDNLKVKVNANLDARKLTVKVLATQDVPTRCHHAKAIELLKVVVKVRQTDDGVYHLGIRIKGDLTDQQKAYLTALVEKHQGQVPGVVIDLKIK